MAGRSVQSFEKSSFFSVFGRWDHFPQVFRQVKKCLILYMHEMIRLQHLVACPNVLILFYGRDWQGGVFKIMKNDHFFSIFSSFVLFSQVFGQVNE